MRELSRGVAKHGAVTAVRHHPQRGAWNCLIAALVLEHIDWRKGVEVIAALRPAACVIIIQENPPGMATAVTPGRRIPASIAAAVEMGQPKLVPHDELLSAFDARGYTCAVTRSREVADGKRLVSTLFSLERVANGPAPF